MPSWTLEQKIWTVETYIKTNKIKQLQRDFMLKFQSEKPPPDRQIYDWVRKFRTYGTVENLCKKSTTRDSHSGRKRIRDEAIIERVRQDVESSPKRSTRKRCQSLDLSRTTLRRILRHDLGVFPYHIQTCQKLTADDRRRRQKMCRHLSDKIEDTPSFLPLLITSDEAHFHLDGQVNSKNNIFWGEKPPLEVAQKPLHSAKVTAWCGIWSKGLIGPYFFEEGGATVTVNSERYLGVLQKLYTDVQSSHPSLLSKVWFQQDGATPHTANIVKQWLKDHFKSRVISSFRDNSCPIEWSPHSPDLSPPDFFLWGYLKDRVYREKPGTLAQLKKSIINECRAIKPQVFKNVSTNFCMRLKKCMDANGGHLEHVL